MVITNIKINRSPENPKNGFLGYCSLTLDNELGINNIKLFRDKEGKIIPSFPTSFNKETQRYHDFVHPINQKFRTYIIKVITEELDQLILEELKS